MGQDRRKHSICRHKCGTNKLCSSASFPLRWAKTTFTEGAYGKILYVFRFYRSNFSLSKHCRNLKQRMSEKGIPTAEYIELVLYTRSPIFHPKKH